MTDQYATHRRLSDDDFLLIGNPKPPYKGKSGSGWYVLETIDENKNLILRTL